MPNWTAPFHAPLMTTEEFKAMKAKYVAKHGYTITLPGLSDIIHIGQPNPMTESEKDFYRRRQWYMFGRKRLREIFEMKEKKRQRFLGMLGSPIPDVVRNAGSIMTALDDAQDAISTLACVGKIVIHFAPRILGRFLAGPINLLMGASDLMNLVSFTAPMRLMSSAKKRKFHAATASNPFTKKARLRRAAKIRNWKPTVGDVLQGLQTTDNIFGIGLSLGPLVGLLEDIVSGGVRLIMGEEVRVKNYPPPITAHQRMALRAAKINAVVNAGNVELDNESQLELYAAGLLGQQVAQQWLKDWNPLEEIQNVDDIELIAPQPADVLTLDIMNEEKKPVSEYTGWPFNGQRWATIGDIRDAVISSSQNNLERFQKATGNSWDGFAGRGFVAETATYMLANLESEDEVEYDYIAGSKIGGDMLETGITPLPGMDFEDLNRLSGFLDEAEKKGLPLAWRSVEQELKNRNIPLVDEFGELITPAAP